MTVVIAEIGQNHCGSIEMAKALIYLAKLNGANMVKFQYYDHKKLYGNLPGIPDASLNEYEAAELFFHGQKIGIEVFFSVFDVLGVHVLDDIGVARYKVAYSQRYNRPLIEAIESTEKPFIISVDRHGESAAVMPCTKLLCVPDYPARAEDYVFTDGIHSGVSDHTIGMAVAHYAIELKIPILEKHFCLNHDIGIDAEWSMTPGELKQLTKQVKCQQLA